MQDEESSSNVVASNGEKLKKNLKKIKVIKYIDKVDISGLAIIRFYIVSYKCQTAIPTV